MGNYKVCVYAICKNEEQFVDRWMDSMSEADQVVVLDTGSEDGTVERLRARRLYRPGRGTPPRLAGGAGESLGPRRGTGCLPVYLVLQRRRLRGSGVLV